MMTTPKDEKPVERLAYSIDEFAAGANVSRPTIYRMIRDGELKTAKVRGRQLIPASEARRLFGEVANV